MIIKSRSFRNTMFLRIHKITGTEKLPYPGEKAGGVGFS